MTEAPIMEEVASSAVKESVQIVESKKTDCITGDLIEESMLITVTEGKEIYNFDFCTLMRNYAATGSLKNPYTKNDFHRDIVLVLENYANIVFRCNGKRLQLNGFLTVAEAYIAIFRAAESLEIFKATGDVSSKARKPKFNLRNIAKFDIRIDDKSILEMDYNREIYEQLGRSIKTPLSAEIEHIITFYCGVDPIGLEGMLKHLSKTSISNIENIVSEMKKELTYGTITII